MQDKKYIKYIFNVHYTFLKRFDHNNLEMQHLIENYPRHYVDPVRINGEDFLITSEWYKTSKELYLKWLYSR